MRSATAALARVRRERRLPDVGERRRLGLLRGSRVCTSILLGGMAASLATPVRAQSLDPELVVEHHEQLDDKDIDTHLGRGLIDRLWAPVDRMQRRLADDHGLHVVAIWSPIYQVGSGVDTLNQAFDLWATWERIVDTGSWIGTGSLELYALHRKDDFLSHDTFDFMADRGLLTPINDAAGGSSSQLSIFAWEQKLFDDRLQLLIGQIDGADLFDQNAYAGYDRESFIHGTLSNNPVRASGPAGLGAEVRVDATPSLYVKYAILDADGDGGRGRYPDFGSLTDGNWGELVEVGISREIAGLGHGHYRFGFQHVDETDFARNSTSWSLSFDQEIGDELGGFLRYADGDGRTDGIERFASLGVVWTHAFGFNNDWLGLGLFWSDPAESGPRDEFGGEVYWRLQVTRRLQLTPGLTLVRRALKQDGDVEAIFNLRLAVSF